MLMLRKKKAGAIAFILFFCLLTYLVLRAFFLEPLNDELLTLFYYIETGKIVGPDAFPDANNHVLISLWGRLMYQQGGTNFFWFRIPGLVGFCLYFWAIFKIITNNKEEIKFSLFIAFAGIVSIPYVLEYFAYARGYGISMGCFLWVVFGAMNIQARIKLLPLLTLFLFMLVAISANFSMITLGLLLLLWVVFQQTLFWKTYRPKEHLAFLGIELIYVLGLLPCIAMSFDLKEKGLLYYGSLEGLWMETGRSLSLYTFFKNPMVLKWIWVAVLIGFLLVIANRIVKFKKEYFRDSIVVFYWFIFGSLTAMVIMAEVLQVNYPSDRTAIYLIPLLFLLITLFCDQIKWMNYLNILFGIFMVSLGLNMNLNTSIFSPEDRLNSSFHNDIRKRVEKGTTISGSPVIVFTWPYAERNQKTAILLNSNEVSELCDVAVVSVRDIRTNQFDEDYVPFSTDPKRMLTAFRRKEPIKRTSIQKFTHEKINSKEEFIPLFNLDSMDTLKAENLLFDIRATIKSVSPIHKLSLVIAVDDSLGNCRYVASEMNWYFQKDKRSITINFPWIMKEKLSREKVVKFYLWNLGRNEVQVENVKLELLRLDEK
jgi:hypothetical protein